MLLCPRCILGTPEEGSGLQTSNFGTVAFYCSLDCSSRWLVAGNYKAFSFPDYQSCSSVVLLTIQLLVVERQQMIYYSTRTLWLCTPWWIITNCGLSELSLLVSVWCLYIQLFAGMHEQSVNHTSLSKKDRPSWYAKLPTAQDAYQLILHNTRPHQPCWGGWEMMGTASLASHTLHWERERVWSGSNYQVERNYQT